jgi:predicted AlkP superfamily pyrophosphatase or phosphodiesterase
MRAALTRTCAVLALLLVLIPSCFASAYDARPRLVVIIVVDQLRADLLERFHDKFGPNGFRLLMERGAYFPSCYYDYADTRTAPGHATLLTGAYADGHGIMSNRWWDAQQNKLITPVEDARTHLLGAEGGAESPKNLLASTLGDELKLATGGKARVFGISLKPYAAVLGGGHAADAAYWITDDGAWVTSSYYHNELAKWVSALNATNPTAKYWNQEWKDASGTVLWRTERKPNGDFYNVVGPTPYSADYELDFARDLITNEKLGSGPATDLLVISLSGFDEQGHATGPDSPQIAAATLALDKQLSDFFGFLGQRLGLANVWIALSADHGVAPMPEYSKELRVAENVRYDRRKIVDDINRQLSAKLTPGKSTQFVVGYDPPTFFLNRETFPNRDDETAAEKMVGELAVKAGMLGYFTHAQLAKGEVPHTEIGRIYLHSAGPQQGWYVMAIPPAFSVSNVGRSTDHGSPYSYDRHVPLALFGFPFIPGIYRTHAEPVDLAPTLASVLGINAPTHSVGRVLTEAMPREATR